MKHASSRLLWMSALEWTKIGQIKLPNAFGEINLMGPYVEFKMNSHYPQCHCKTIALNFSQFSTQC